MDREYSGNKTWRIESTTFEDAAAQNRELDKERLFFPFSSKEYKSMKDTVSDQAKVCPTCHFPRGEHGWVRMDWPVGHPLFGKAIQCPRCGS